MSAAEWPRPPESVPPPQTRGAGRKRRARTAKETSEPPVAPAPLAGFSSVEVRPLNAEHWAVAPVLWWQPDLPGAVPASGLRNERRHKIPSAGFLNVAESPRCPAAVIATLDAAAIPGMPRTIPAADLTPLGWDARAAAIEAGEGEKR